MILFFASFVLLLLIGVPISISIGGASAVLGCLNLGYPPLMVIGQKMVSGIDSFLLIAIHCSSWLAI